MVVDLHDHLSQSTFDRFARNGLVDRAAFGSLARSVEKDTNLSISHIYECCEGPMLTQEDTDCQSSSSEMPLMGVTEMTSEPDARMRDDDATQDSACQSSGDGSPPVRDDGLLTEPELCVTSVTYQTHVAGY